MRCVLLLLLLPPVAVWVRQPWMLLFAAAQTHPNYPAASKRTHPVRPCCSQQQLMMLLLRWGLQAWPQCCWSEWVLATRHG